MSKSKPKRLRIFAGPNGSGKTTLVKAIINRKIPLGAFVNADEIEELLRQTKAFPLSSFDFVSETKALQSYIQAFGMTPRVLKDADVYRSFYISQNHICFSGEYNSYVAADIAGFIRKQLLLKGKSFSL